jgi:hypothetical protein
MILRVAVAAAPITSDLACVRCGYNLRGITEQTACPECGLAAHRSAAAGEALADCPAGWVTKVAAGAALLLAGYLGPLVAIALSAIPAYERSALAQPAVAMAYLALHATGAFLVTAREPGGRRRGLADRLAAWALRLCSLGPLVAVPLFWYWMIWSSTGSVGRHMTLLEVLYGAILPCPVLTMLRLQRLMRRVGRPRVAEHAAIAGVGLSALVAAIVFVSWATSYRGHAPTYIAALAVAAVVFYFWCVGALARAAWHLRAAAREARRAWREADASRPDRAPGPPES